MQPALTDHYDASSSKSSEYEASPKFDRRSSQYALELRELFLFCPICVVSLWIERRDWRSSRRNCVLSVVKLCPSQETTF
jgi:hypothetical protein